MKLARPVLALALGAAVVISGTQAEAALKKKPPLCNLLTDPADDAKQGPSANAALDILSADIASDKKNITAVIRVKKLAATAPSASPTGMEWGLSFTADGNIFTLSAGAGPLGDINYYASYEDATTGQGNLYGGGATGAFDTAKNEVRISVPTSVLAAQATLKQGAKITDISALTGAQLRGPDPSKKVSSGGTIFTLRFLEADTGTTTKSYLAGGINCVTPGK